MSPKQPAGTPGRTIAVMIAGLVVFAAVAITGLIMRLEETALIAILGTVSAFFFVVVGRMKGRGQAVVLLAIAAASSATACGSSAIGTQARIASTLAVAAQVAGDQVDAALERRIAQLETANAALSVEAQIAAMDAEELHWAPAMRALDAIRESLRTWASALELARTAGEGSPLPAIAQVVGRLVQLYGRLVDVAADLDVDIPPLPSEVTALVAAVAGGQ